ncbi:MULTISPECIES: SCO2522 family protein [unclassified Nocardia]|uniref:SCO2522 family protein n=1 Tax=Nocardia sp. NPDC060220 TaxID=3347076 RepID=UPI00365D20FB
MHTSEEFTGYVEAGEMATVPGTDMSHLSIEVGHFYMEDLLNGVERIEAQFERVRAMLDALVALESVAWSRKGGEVPFRVSTCFLLDDYFRADTDPREIIPKLRSAAAGCGVPIDYLAREAGCHEAPRVGEVIPLAKAVADMLVEEPIEHTTGQRPPAQDLGWLANGRRSSESEAGPAMDIRPYMPPREFGRQRSLSIFADIEMWRADSDSADGRLWSCPFLASVWHLLRLGMLRYQDEVAVTPVAVHPDVEGFVWPSDWRDLPAVMQLNPNAQPFTAYRSLSLMPQRYIGIEHAVRVILDHLDLDERVVSSVVDRARGEGLALPGRVSERIGHVLFDGS